MGGQGEGRGRNITGGIWGNLSACLCPEISFHLKEFEREKVQRSLPDAAWGDGEHQTQSQAQSRPAEPLPLFMAPGTLTLSFFCRRGGRIPETDRCLSSFCRRRGRIPETGCRSAVRVIPDPQLLAPVLPVVLLRAIPSPPSPPSTTIHVPFPLLPSTPSLKQTETIKVSRSTLCLKSARSIKPFADLPSDLGKTPPLMLTG